VIRRSASGFETSVQMVGLERAILSDDDYWRFEGQNQIDGSGEAMQALMQLPAEPPVSHHSTHYSGRSRKHWEPHCKLDPDTEAL
jgi:hypothetical protein